jgi:chemotaxis protein methyltransferase CheR
LDNNQNIRQQCELLLTVSISRFFRDAKLWKVLEIELLPKIIKGNNDSINIWSAGCASGEEVYSFKIVWDAAAKYLANPPKLDITATDINPTYLQRARAGVYSASSLKEVTETKKCNYFQHHSGENLYRIRSDLKKGIRWLNHHLISDPPGTNFDIIFLRNNILTYGKDRLKNRAFANVLAGLSSGGLLVIGSHESLPFDPYPLTSVTRLPYVFRKEARS